MALDNTLFGGGKCLVFTKRRLRRPLGNELSSTKCIPPQWSLYAMEYLGTIGHVV